MSEAPHVDPHAYDQMLKLINNKKSGEEIRPGGQRERTLMVLIANREEDLIRTEQRRPMHRVKFFRK